jgi:hypothetical protein
MLPIHTNSKRIRQSEAQPRRWSCVGEPASREADTRSTASAPQPPGIVERGIRDIIIETNAVTMHVAETNQSSDQRC